MLAVFMPSTASWLRRTTVPEMPVPPEVRGWEGAASSLAARQEECGVAEGTQEPPMGALLMVKQPQS